jgi:hypothetical protein
MRSKLIQQILDDTPLELVLEVQNQMAFINLITELGYRENKAWRDDDPEDDRILSMLCKLAADHTSHQMRNVNKKLEAKDIEIAQWKGRFNHPEVISHRADISKELEEQAQVTHAIGELLAVLHGDGGHYTAKHGLLKSIKDAQELLHAEWINNRG